MAVRAPLLRLALATWLLAAIPGTGSADPSSDALALDALVIELSRDGRVPGPIGVGRDATSVRETGLGPDHPVVAMRLHELAQRHWVEGRYADAEPLYRRALAIRERALGTEHPDVAASADGLGRVYDATGRPADAEPLLRRALAIRETALGADHPQVALGLNNLAHAVEAQGRYAEAEPLYRRALAIRERVLGADHPDVALSLNNLAVLHVGQGRYAEAEPLYRRSIAIDENAGAPNPVALASKLRNLAMLYKNTGRTGNAEPLARRALALWEDSLGPDHELVAHALDTVAAIHLERAQHAEAEPLLLRSLTIREARPGPLHPDLAVALNNLAASYRAQARHAEAEAAYVRSLAVWEKALGPDHPNVASVLLGLAGLYADQGRSREAIPHFTRSLAIAEAALGPDHRNVALGLNGLAVAHAKLGDGAAAEPLQKRSLAIWEKALGPDHPDVATALVNLGLLYHEQGRLADAEPLYRRALAIREKALGSEHPDVGFLLNNLGGLHVRAGRYDLAETHYRRGIAIIERALGADHPGMGAILSNLAEVYGEQRRLPEAETLYRRSLAITETAFGADNQNVALRLNNLATVYHAQQRHADAEALLARSLAIFERSLGPEHPQVANTLNNLAELHRSNGRIDAALALGRRAVGILARRLGEIRTERTSGGNAEQRSHRTHFLNHVSLLHAAGEPTATAESFAVGQWAQTSSAASAVAGMAARFAAGTDTLAAVVRERQDVTERWERLDAALVKAASEPPDRRRADAEARMRAELIQATTQLDALDARIAAEFPRYAALSRPTPLTLPETQALLGDDEALLAYVVSGDRTWLWAVRRDRAALHRIELGASALAVEVAALRQRLDPELNPTLRPFDARRAHALHQRILAPARPLLDGARHVFVVPDGALESLPVGVLVTQPPDREPETPDDHRRVAWLARDHAITVLPSVGSLRALRALTATARAPSPYVGIGNPRLEGQPGATRGVKLASLFRGAVADVAEVRRLDPLPDTADELRAVAAALGAGDDSLYMAERATEPMVRTAGLDRYRVIGFATHGLVSGNLGLAEPALVLTPPAVGSPDDDGLLTASEIARLTLNADWVVLSACNTAADDGTPDAGSLSGLAKAFFYAGARSLLVSHWSVPSRATVRLVTGAFAALRQDPAIGRAEALRRSMTGMIDDATLPPEFAHPLAWAPFVLAGEGGRGR